MTAFEHRILKFIRENQMLQEGDRVVVGFSGGADSVTLLTVLDELKDILGISLIAVHVNHGIREEAGEDESFAAGFCEDRCIRFVCVREDVPALADKYKLTEEEAGRKLRYETFNRVAKENGARRIAVAHHQNDLAETMLMNLFRGSSIHGAGAIRPVRDNIIRPLLCVSRAEIEKYLGEKGISFCTDQTNKENIHTRNFIRNEIMPLVAENVNDRAVQHIAEAAEDFVKADDFINGCVDRVYSAAVSRDCEGLVLDSEQLRQEAGIIQSGIVLRCFEELAGSRKDFTRAHVNSVTELFYETDGTSFISLPFGLEALRQYGRVRLQQKDDGHGGISSPDSLPGQGEILEIRVEINSGETKRFDLFGEFEAEVSVFNNNLSEEIPKGAYTKWFDYDRIQAVVFRHRKQDDYIRIAQNEGLHKKPLCKLMTDEKIPITDRDKKVVLADGDEILWLLGGRMNDAFRISSDTTEIMAIRILDGGKEIG